MSFTNDLETRVLQYAFTTGSPTRPTAWYVGLFTAAPAIRAAARKCRADRMRGRR